MINKLTSSSKSAMTTRILTGLLLIVVLVPCLVLGGWFFFVLFALFAVIGVHEILNAPGINRYHWSVKLVVYVFVLSFIFWVFIKNWMLYDITPFSSSAFYLNDIFVSITGIVIYGFLLMMFAVFSAKFTFSDATYLFTVGVLYSLGFLSMYFLRYFPNSPGICTNYPDFGSLTVNPSWSSVEIRLDQFFTSYYESHGLTQAYNSSLIFFFVLIGTWGADVGAYFFGTFFGKHRMNPRISPNKTWEGFLGGALVSIGLSLGFAAICEYCFDSPLVPGLIQFQMSEVLQELGLLGGSSWVFLVLIAFLMPIIGNVGGFTFSLIKRQFGVKDFGRLFPGHGGVIDRFDSIMTNSIMCMLLLLFTSHAWNFLL